MAVTAVQIEAARKMIDVPSGNEAVVRDYLLTWLFRVLPVGDAWQRAFAEGAEFLVRTEWRRDGKGRGRVDTYYSNRIIEYESDLTRKLDEALDQLRDYAAAVWNHFGRNVGELVLVATDVRSWYVFRAAPPEGAGIITPDLVRLIPDDRWVEAEPTDGDLERLIHLLETALIGGVHPLTSDALLQHFGPETSTATETITELESLIQRKLGTASVREAVDHWRDAQRSVMPDEPEVGLYAQHLYIILLARLVVAELLRAPEDDRGSLAPLILDGTFFMQRLRVTNLVDKHDCFGWIRSDGDVLEILKRLGAELARFDPRAAGFDNIISAIYDDFMPARHRDLLGQRLTPEDLADHVTGRVLKDDVDRPFLDPFCGDGRFLRACILLKRIEYLGRGMGPGEVAERLSLEVFGADIDPVAVALARSLFALTAADVLQHVATPVEVPVFHADVVFGPLHQLPPELSPPRFALAMNPPWLAMSREPGAPYKRALSAHARDYGIEPTGSSGHHVELATVAALQVARRFQAEGARVGAVLPYSVWNGNQHSAFRQERYASVIPIRPEEVWDLSAVKDLFAVPCFVWFGTRDGGHRASPARALPALFWKNLTDSHAARKGTVSLRRLGDETAWAEGNEGIKAVDDFDHYPAFFSQGADLMPRAALFVDRIDAVANLQTVGIRTSAYERANKSAKLFRGQRFDGMVDNRLLYPAATSACLLPFRVLPFFEAALPVHIAAGVPEVVQREGMDEHSAEYFTAIDRALVEELGPRAKLIRERVDFRNKLSSQTQPDVNTRRFLVLSGMGGAHPCAGLVTLEPGVQAPIIDQTLYYAYFADETEAYYVVGILNSDPLDLTIEPFQSTGAFGRRHVHELAYRPIPPFAPGNPDHAAVAAAAKALVECVGGKLPPELESYVQAYKGSLAQRRRKVRRAFQGKWTELNDAAARVIEAAK